MLNVIVNPKVRRVDRLVAELGRRFQEAGADHRFFYSSKQGNAIKYAHSLTAAGQTQIVVVGGDGTLNEVLSGIVEPARVSLGIIPAGTGNDFAETARIPFGVRAADLILQTEPVPTDYIECGARRSLNIAGTGIDVEILRRCERMRGSKKGKYLRSLIATLFRYRGCTLTVTAENGEATGISAVGGTINAGTTADLTVSVDSSNAIAVSAQGDTGNTGDSGGTSVAGTSLSAAVRRAAIVAEVEKTIKEGDKDKHENE